MAVIYKCDNCGDPVAREEATVLLFSKEGGVLHGAEQYALCVVCSTAMQIHLKRNRLEVENGRRPQPS